MFVCWEMILSIKAGSMAEHVQPPFSRGTIASRVWYGTLYYTVLWRDMGCGVVWCGVVWCGVVWCGVVWCGVVWCATVWYGMVQYSTVWYSVVQV